MNNFLIRFRPLFLTLFLLSGCTTDYIEVDRTVPPYFHTKNVFQHAEGLDAIPHRVLVLPSWGDAPTVTLRQLDEILVQELGKVNVAEVVLPPREKIASRRSNQEFNLEEAKTWAEQAGAQGVLTCRVIVCKPHRPTSLGVALRLWNVPKDATVWAVDETLDSQLTIVANGARNYYLTNFRAQYPTRRSETILESPNMFFQYVFAELLSTLPTRPPIPTPDRSRFPRPQKPEPEEAP